MGSHHGSPFQMGGYMRKKLKMGILLFLLSLLFTIPAYAGGTDDWLDGWDYEIQGDGSTVYLTGYSGDNEDLDIYGKAVIDGNTYDTVLYYDSSANKSPLTGNTIINSISFYPVDGRKVKISYQYSLQGCFANMPNLETISFGDGFDSSGIQDMQSMCVSDTSLKEIDFENLDVNSCGVFTYCFQDCKSLTEMDIHVPYAYAYGGMFRGCTSLESVRIRGKRAAGKFTSINYLFEGCSALKNVELIDIKTGGEEEFKNVFKGCTSLENIDLSVLDFSSATNVSGMLQACSSLTDIDLSPIDFSKVTEMSSMFAGCRGLTSLDLSGHTWISGGPKMNQVISCCPNLTEIIVDEYVEVSPSTYAIGGEDQYTKTKIVGRMSDSFRQNFLAKLLKSQRYITALDVKASIKLVGDPYDSWYYGLKLSNDKLVRVQQNTGSDTVYFDHEGYRLYIGEPGEYTLTLTQGKKAFDINTGYDKVNPVNETEDGFRCAANPLTKTINVTMDEAGDVEVEEI